MISIKRQRGVLFCVMSALVLLWSEFTTKSQLEELYSSQFRRQIQGNSEMDESSNVTAAVSSLKASGTDEGTQKKPIMHTFFEPDPMGWCCGMMNDDHYNLLSAWERNWQDKGWETRVLTKEDAMKHPEFEALSKRFRDLALTTYNQKCYWRWLAMASIFDDNDPTTGGGGFMSDYDTIPLELDSGMGRKLAAANDGKFATYQGHVPSLIHASRVEWDRVLHLMVSVIPEGVHPGASDMISLQEVRKSIEGADIVWRQNVLKSFPYLKNDEGEVVFDCQKVKNMIAVHLSHHASKAAYFSGFYPNINGNRGMIGGRAEVALRVMKDYKEQCKQKEDAQILPVVSQS